MKIFEVLEERIQFQRNLDRQKGKGTSWKFMNAARITYGYLLLLCKHYSFYVML